MKTLPLILERADTGWYGRIEDINDFTPVTFSEDIEDVESNIRELIKDHQEHDEQDEWTKIDAETVVFQPFYDLAGLFERFDMLKISSIAKIAGINPSLLRQYVSRKKYPGEAQAKKIETAIKKIAEELSKVSVYT